MEFLGVGGQELLVVLLLAALVLGPERVVRTARELAKLVRNLKAYVRSFSDELKSEMDLLDELNEIKKDITKL
jgi:Tat protein translocase TatB subunit